MSQKGLLVISYYFPPNPGIGSRRWAKYGKVLQQNGIDVHVLMAQTPQDSKSSWDEDAKGITTHMVPSNYPSILDDWSEKGVLDKIKYRLADRKVKKKVVGMPYDRAAFWKETMLEKARAVIRENNIDTVIVSTPPHRSAFYALDLKDEFSYLKLYVDFRDPWTWGSFREYPHLTGEDREAEEKMAQAVIEGADRLIVPVQKMWNSIVEMYPGSEEKLYLLSSAFDKDDFKNVSRTDGDEEVTNFIYYGSLYDNLDDHFSEIARALKKFPARCRFDIYSKSQAYKTIFEEIGVADLVHYHDEMPSNQIFQKVVDADYVFLFKPYEYGKDNVSTKYFEIVNTKTPVIIIADQGMASEYIVNNRLGIHTEVKEAEHTLVRVLDGSLQVEYDKSFSVDELSFQEAGKRFIKDLLN